MAGESIAELSCDEARELAAMELDGDGLLPGQERAWRGHVRNCSSCEEAVSRLISVDQLLRTYAKRKRAGDRIRRAALTLIGGLTVAASAALWLGAARTMAISRILGVMEAEARATLSGDIDQLMSLYSQEQTPKVVDHAGRDPGGTLYSGRAAIGERYRTVFRLPIAALDHVEIEVRLNGLSSAQAKAKTEMAWMKDSIPVLQDLNWEKWEFRKEDGQWRIVRFDFNLPASEEPRLE